MKKLYYGHARKVTVNGYHKSTFCKGSIEKHESLHFKRLVEDGLKEGGL